MVKKRLASGQACPKCVQAEELLKRRGFWDRIDEVLWVEEGNSDSPGAALAKRHRVEVAPFFVLVDDDKGETLETSVLRLCKRWAKESPLAGMDTSPDGASPQEILRSAWEDFGEDCVIAFSGAEDVILLAFATEIGAAFPVVLVDTGRLHPETLALAEQARLRYGLELAVTAPAADAVGELVRKKGLFSFYDDGHQECCRIRKVEPLARHLASFRAWVTGRRPDQNPATRSAMPPVERDDTFVGNDGQPLVKFNPLATWTSEDVWREIRHRKMPYNPLHDRGYRSIGCAPCTRPVGPHQHERDGRWWWESEGKRECGLHWPGDDE